MLDKAPLPPIKGVEMSVTKEEDPTPRPKTSNVLRSPRRLPKLTGNVGTLPEVEDLEEDEDGNGDDAASMSIPSAPGTPKDNVSVENKSVPPSSRSGSRSSPRAPSPCCSL